MRKNKITPKLFSTLFLTLFIAQTAHSANTSYTIVDTGQNSCYGNTSAITCPEDGGSFNGQDAQYQGNQPSYQDNNDGTVTDLNTGLIWQITPSTNRVSFAQAKKNSKSFELAGYDDWRLPTIKELYSLMDFRGQTTRDEPSAIPYINTDYFDFFYGDTSKGARLIDCQYWSATEYTGTTMNNQHTAFGVNFADGRIKGYPTVARRDQDKRFVRYVRGNPDYGTNDFVDNGNGTITDKATGLTWMQVDSGTTLNWQQALNHAENMQFAGYDDWRLPNAKELQSIIDYTKSPKASKSSQRGQAIDPLFKMTDTDGWYWSSTTHLEHGSASSAVYLCFGQGWGYMSFRGSAKKRMDVHGAGAQRSDPKSGNPSDYPEGFGPQGDERRVNNYVRLVKGGGVAKSNTQPEPSGKYEKRATKAAVITPANRMSQRGSQPSSNKPPQTNQEMGHLDPQGSLQNRSSHNNFTSRLDKNNDGKVSKSEFDGPSQHFDQLDINNDGYLNEDEAPKGPPPRRK